MATSGGIMSVTAINGGGWGCLIERFDFGGWVDLSV